MKSKLINKEVSLKLPEFFYRRFLILILGIIICSFGMALLIKSNLGQSTLTGISYNLGIVLGLKTGTIVGFINYACFAGQVIFLKKEFKIIQILQLIVTVIFSTLINFYLYSMPFISNLKLEYYSIKLLILIFGIVCIAYGVSLMLIANLATLPFEAFANVIALKYEIKFGTLRRYIDISLVLLSLIIIFVYKIPNTSIREGTIIYTFLSGTLMNVFLNANKNIKLESI